MTPIHSSDAKSGDLKILVTGSSGKIGSRLCEQLSCHHQVHGLDCRDRGSADNCSKKSRTFSSVQLDILDYEALHLFFVQHRFDAVIHCAGVSRQLYGHFDYSSYREANVTTTENLALLTAESNPDAQFIFLSSVLVYGENLTSMPADEQSPCTPGCDYSRSKLEAEECLRRLDLEKKLGAITILRLAQVYDNDFSENLDKRVFSPFKLSYLKLGRGDQKMSALSRQNFIDFIRFLLEKRRDDPLENRFEIFNVTDQTPYSFGQIIKVFRRSSDQPNRPVCPPSPLDDPTGPAHAGPGTQAGKKMGRILL